MSRLNFFTLKLSLLLILATVWVGCAESSEESNDNGQTEQDVNLKVDSISNTRSVVKYQGEIFSIPSPVQSVILIKKANVKYNEDLMNDAENASSYVNEYKKALNLGVYGTDLAYLSNFENTQLSLKYLSTIETLASDLNIQSAVSKEILERFTENIGNRDSLYALNGEFYRAGYRYLKRNERNKVASLILTGGWVEALHLTLDASRNNELIRNRVGEQKSALNSIVRLTAKIDQQEIARINEKLRELQAVFDELEYAYEFQKPITDKSDKTTYINSKSSVVVTDEQLEKIKEKTREIRNLIIS